jgi:predicted amidophosphoribosyltransferase
MAQAEAMPVPLALVPILTAVAPPLCWSCGGGAPAREPLCRGCRARLRFLGPEIARIGGLPAWAAVAYEGPARDLVRGLKYRGAAGLAEALAAQIAANAPERFLGVSEAPAAWLTPPGVTPTLVPVPGARPRVRRRGYDQAGLVAAALARRRHLPLAACLERRGSGASQVGRGRGARRAALAGAIGVRSPPPADVVLVDDVITTGATALACAAALREVGCERVAVVAYARTPGR